VAIRPSSDSTTRRDERRIREKRNEAMNDLLRRGRVEPAEQQRDEGGRFQGLDQGARGGEQQPSSKGWLNRQLRGEDAA
jgi:hypothetical protein